MTARGFLGSGDLYIARYVGGVQGPWMGPFEADKFEIKPNVELKEQVSKSRENYGNVIETVALNKPGDFTVDLSEVNKETLSIALLGTAITLTQASGSWVAAAYTSTKGAWIPLGKGNVTVAGLVVTNAAASTTYVLGTDYEVNYRLGWLRAISTGAIVDGAANIKVTGAYGAISGTKISGGVSSQIRAAFKLDGKNFADDLPCIVTVAEGVVASSAAFDFLSSEFAKVSMPGKMKTPVGATEPFTVELRDA